MRHVDAYMSEKGAAEAYAFPTYEDVYFFGYLIVISLSRLSA